MFAPLLTRNVLLSPSWPYGAMSRARSARTSTREAEYTVVCSSVSGGWIKYHISIIHFKLPAPLSPFKSIKLLFQKLLSGNFSPKRQTMQQLLYCLRAFWIFLNLHTHISLTYCSKYSIKIIEKIIYKVCPLLLRLTILPISFNQIPNVNCTDLTCKSELCQFSFLV